MVCKIYFVNFYSIVVIKDTTYDVFEGLLSYIYRDKVPFSELDYENIFGKGYLAIQLLELKYLLVSVL